MSTKQALFKVTQLDHERKPDHEFVVYDDGTIDGFPDDCVVVNKHAALLRSAIAKCNRERN